MNRLEDGHAVAMVAGGVQKLAPHSFCSSAAEPLFFCFFFIFAAPLGIIACLCVCSGGGVADSATVEFHSHTITLPAHRGFPENPLG